MFDLTGKRALVTGAGRHVGLAIAEWLARAGADVALNDVDAERAEQAAKQMGSRAVAAPADVTDLEAVQAMVRRIEGGIGPVDILVNNAGNAGAREFARTQFLDMLPESWARFVDVNLYGVMNCTHAVLGGMCERGWGRIITVSSDAGRTGTPMGISVYGAAKAGAVGFQRHLCTEVGRFGVTVNAISLGMIPQGWDPGSPRRVPMQRWGTPEDAAGAVVFLASEEAGWVTGQNLSINGGEVHS